MNTILAGGGWETQQTGPGQASPWPSSKWGPMVARTPRALKEKRAEMAYVRAQLARRTAQLDTEVEALDYALRVLNPGWQPPRRISKPVRQTLLGQRHLQLLKRLRVSWEQAAKSGQPRSGPIAYRD